MSAVSEEFIENYLKKLSKPAAIIDESFICLYSNRIDLFPAGQSIISLFQDNIKMPLKKEYAAMALINGTSYCSIITPLDDRLYLCKFINYNSLFRLAEYTDFYNKVFPLISGVEYNTSALWRNFRILRSKLGSDENYDCGESLSLFSKHLTAINSLTKNVIEYFNMLVYDPLKTNPLNISLLLSALVSRCNSIISPTKRYVDFRCEELEIYIDADARFTVAAAVNAVQNALIYSPRESVPFVTLTEDCVTGAALIRIVNRTVVNIDFIRLTDDDLNSSSGRFGCGIPILKRYAKLVGGSFSIDCRDSVVEARLVIPTIEKDNIRGDKMSLKSGVFANYETNIPDIVELMMNEVVDLFGSQQSDGG